MILKREFSIILNECDIMKKCLVTHRVISFEIIAPYTIKVQFEDDSSQTINFRAVLGGGMYRPLRDTEFFNKVFLSDGIATLAWPDGVDFNPDHLYHWPDYEKLYAERVKEWEGAYLEQHS